MPPVIGTLVSSRIATLAELQSAYGVSDAYDLLEVVNVDIVNERRIRGSGGHNNGR